MPSGSAPHLCIKREIRRTLPSGPLILAVSRLRLMDYRITFQHRGLAVASALRCHVKCTSFIT